MPEHSESETKSPQHIALQKTALLSEGKYDAIGKRVAPLRAALPFQTAETVNPSATARRAAQHRL